MVVDTRAVWIRMAVMLAKGYYQEGEGRVIAPIGAFALGTTSSCK